MPLAVLWALTLGGAILEPRPLASPSPEVGRWPDWVVGAEGPTLSWVEPTEKGTRLRTAALADGSWSEPTTIAAGSDWFVNWADTPRLGATREGRLAASWLQRLGEGTYAYGVRFARAGAEGWDEPRWLHDDRSATEHGFVSWAPLASGGLAAVWLDGRATGDGGAMTLRARTLGAEVGPEAVLDEHVCDCCRTSAVALHDGRLVVAYRDRSAQEVRDISVVRSADAAASGWSEPREVWPDRWTTSACPVNGPALATDGERVAVLWYTEGAVERPEVRLAFSDDGGASFAAPRRIDDGDPRGHVDLVWVEEDAWVASWLERRDEGWEWRARVVDAGGAAGASVALGRIDEPRRTGFLRLVATPQVTAVWTEPAGGLRVVRLERRADD